MPVAPVALVPIAEIKIGERHRKDHGDIKALAQSIVERGLLQPIGITPGKELIFGRRRILACQRMGRSRIEARVLDVDALQGEWAENEVRKDFTPSERAAIVEALRTFAHGGDRRSDQSANWHDKTSTEEAAKRAGFGSRREYFRVQAVVDEGTPELVEAMDAGKVSISAASELTRLPPQRQREVLGADPGALQEVVGSLRHGRGDPDPPSRPEFSEGLVREAGERLQKLVIHLRACAAEVRDSGVTPAVIDTAPPASRKQLLDAEKHLRECLWRVLHQGAVSRTWGAYEAAYRRRYGVAPTRNATVNGQLAQFCRRVPVDEAPAIAAFYVTHDDAYYVRTQHAVGPLLKGAEALRTQWLSGRRVTGARARQDERTATNLDNAAEAVEILRRSDHA